MMICVKAKDEGEDTDKMEEEKQEPEKPHHPQPQPLAPATHQQQREIVTLAIDSSGGELGPTVNWKNRPKNGCTQSCCGYFGFFLIFVQLLILISFHTQKNGYPIYDHRRYSEGTSGLDAPEPAWCKKGYINVDNRYCLAPQLFAEYSGCVPRERDPHAPIECYRRRLQAAEEEEETSTSGAQPIHPPGIIHTAFRRLAPSNSHDVWDVLADHAYIPVTMVMLLIGVGILWILLLQKWAKPVIWIVIGTFLASSFGCSFIPLFIPSYECVYDDNHEYGYERGSHTVSPDSDWEIDHCISEGGRIHASHGPFLWPFLIPFVLIGAFSLYYRQKIHVASICLSNCAHILLHRPMIIASSLIVFGAFVFYFGMWIGGVIQAEHILKVHCDIYDGPRIESGNFCGYCLSTVCLLLFPTYIYFQMMYVPTSAAGVGGWYFKDDPDLPAQPAIEGLKWTFTSSSGPIFLTSMLSWPIINLRLMFHHHWAKYACFPCFPAFWAYYALCGTAMFCVRGAMCIHRFMLIAHTFHGGDIFVVSNKAWKLLKVHVGGAVVTETVSMLVLNYCATALAVIFTFATWAWMEYVLGEGRLDEMGECLLSPGWWFVFTLATIFGIWLFHQASDIISVLILIFLSLLGRTLHSEEDMGLFVGLFVGAICNLLLHFLSQIIGSGMDTIFYCYALEAEFLKAYPHPGENGHHDVSDKASLTACIKDHIVHPFPESLQLKASSVGIEEITVKEVQKEEPNENNQ